MGTNQLQRNYITIVSGLPRSGTSMAMNALAAGGIEPLTDQERMPDADNPKGYFEFEPVKKMKHDTDWMNDAVGKAVKIVYRLLYELPSTYQYRIIFMRRHLSEVLLSQQKMLQRSGAPSEPVSDYRMRTLFASELIKCESWLTKQPNIRVLDANHHDMIHDSLNQVQKINEFLDGGLNVEAMASVVDPTLYRNRNE